MATAVLTQPSADKTKPSTIDMKLASMAAGIKIPYTKFGLTVFSQVLFSFKLGGETHTYALGVPFGFGQGTLLIGGVATDWFKIKHTKNAQTRIPRLEGLLADVTLSTSVVLGELGTIDINFTVYDENNQALMSVSRVETDAQGVLAGDIKLRGKLLKLPGKDDGEQDDP